MEKITAGDVIQLTESAQEGWIGCLMIVDEVTKFGVLAYTKIPCKGDAYLRVRWDQFELIGRAALIQRDVEQPE